MTASQIVRRNSVTPDAVTPLCADDLTERIQVWRDARAAVTRSARILGDALYDEVPRYSNSRDRGRLLRAKRATHRLAMQAGDQNAARAALTELESISVAPDHVATLQTCVTREVEAKERLANCITDAIAKAAASASALLQTEPIATTLAIASPDFAAQLFAETIPTDVDNRIFRTAIAFVKRIALKTSPFGYFTTTGPAGCDATHARRGVVVPRTVTTSLIFAALYAGESKAGTLVLNSIRDNTGTGDWLVPVHRVTVGDRAIRIETTGRPSSPVGEPLGPEAGRAALALGIASPALDLPATRAGGDELRHAAKFIMESTRQTPVVNDIRQRLLALAEIVDDMRDADGRQRCDLAQQFLMVLNQAPRPEAVSAQAGPHAALYDSAPHPAAPPVSTTIADQAGDSIKSALCVDAEYLTFARFARRHHGRRLDGVLAEYLTLGGGARVARTIDLTAAGSLVSGSPTVTAAIAATYLQSVGKGYVVNGVHTSAAGLLARPLDPTGCAAHDLAALLRAAAPTARMYQFTCWSDWISTQAVAVPELPAVRLPGDSGDPNDGAASLADFTVEVGPTGAPIICGPDGGPAAFSYVGAVPYALLSGFSRMLAVLSAPWLIDYARRIPGPDERCRATWRIPTLHDIRHPDPAHTIDAMLAWLADAEAPDEFFATFISAAGTRSKPQWYSQASPVCLLHLARAVTDNHDSIVELTECVPARGAIPAVEYIVPHLIEVGQ